MVKLTEDMVVARSKGSDLHNVRKLNCWGSDITDVSVVRSLPVVEVLSLSVNKICTLADFQYCPNLQELYIRKNTINDINEVLYLRQLPKLKSLWLADNPCADFEQYRQTVLRALPHLQKLDNVAVEPEDVQKAMVCGLPLPISDSPVQQREEPELPRSASMGGESLRSESGPAISMSDCSPPASERRFSQSNTRNSQQDLYGNHSDGYEYSSQTQSNSYYDQQEESQSRRSSVSYSSSGPTSQQQSNSNTAYDERRVSHSSNTQRSPQQYRRTSQQQYQQQYQQQQQEYDDNSQQTRRVSNTQAAPSGTARKDSESSGVHYRNKTETEQSDKSRRASYPATQSPSRRISGQVVAEADSQSDTYGQRQAQYREQQYSRENEEPEQRGYNRGDGHSYSSPPSEVRQSPVGYEYRAASQERYEQQPKSTESNGHHYSNGSYQQKTTKIERVERPSPTKPLPARPKTRNANVLSAVLCLIKELDYSNLEVIEMAVRCRMEELED